MKKQEIITFIGDKQAERLEPIYSRINQLRDDEFDAWRIPFDEALDKYDRAFNDMVPARNEVTSTISELMGYGMQQSRGMAYAWNEAHPMYKAEGLGYSSDYYNESVRHLGDSYGDTPKRDAMLRRTFSQSHERTPEVTNLYKEASAITKEFDAIRTNIDALRGYKKMLNFLEGIGFDRDEILRYEQVESVPALVSVDKKLIFGDGKQDV